MPRLVENDVNASEKSSNILPQFSTTAQFGSSSRPVTLKEQDIEQHQHALDTTEDHFFIVTFVKEYVYRYISQFRGSHNGASKALAIATPTYIFWAWLGAFIGIWTLAFLHQEEAFGQGNTMIVASFGAQVNCVVVGC
jgi:hypothetical protein